MTPQTILNRYVIKEHVGSGGMGTVFVAFDRLTGETVALKRVRVDAKDGTPLSTHAKLALTNEFEVLASLRHPNVVSVLDYGIDQDGQPFFTMQLFEDALNLREATIRMTFREKLSLIIQVFDALKYLRRRGIVHRDIKPENILVTKAGIVKIVDFGLAIDKPLDEESELSGTVAYIAPEIVMGGMPTIASDMYSVGVILYELLTGTPLYTETNVHKLIYTIISSKFDPQPLIEIIENNLSTEEVNLLEDAPTVRLDRASYVLDYASPDNPVQSPYPIVNIVAGLLIKDPDKRISDINRVTAVLYNTAGEEAPPQSPENRESFLQAARFTGRERELRQLTDALNDMLMHTGSLWLIGGESGVGKSRLTNEIHNLALVKGVLVLTGEALHDGGQPYQIWRNVVRHLLLNVPVSDEQAEVLQLLVPDIEAILGRSLPEPAADLQPAVVTEHILYLFDHIQHPILLIVEDLQWETPESMAILSQLSERVAKRSLLVLGTYRIDETPALPEQFPNAKQLRLERFDRDAISQLLHAMVGEVGSDPQLVTTLQRETEGNVFFLVETVRALAEDVGTLEAIDSATVPQTLLTGGIQRIMEHRIQRVPADYHPLLEVAAIAGRELDRKILNVGNKSHDIEDWLTALANAAVIEYQNERWRFTHDKVREYIIASLDDHKKRSLHRQVAEAIEGTYSPEEQAAALVVHWRAAGDITKELASIRIAGERAKKIGIYDDARELYERALSIADSPDIQIEFNNHLGGIYEYVSDYEAAERHLTLALDLTKQTNQTDFTADILDKMGWIDIRLGAADKAEERAQEVLRIGHQRDDDMIRMRGLTLIGVVQHIKGNMQAAYDAFKEALPYAENTNQPDILAIHLNSLGAAEAGIGKTEDAIATLSRASTLAQEIGNPALIGNIEGTLGRLLFVNAQLDEADIHFISAKIAFQRGKNTYGEALSNCYLGFIALRRSERTKARDHIRNAIDQSVAIGATANALMALCGAAELHRQEGNAQRAAELIGFVREHPSSQEDADILAESEQVMRRINSEELDTWMAAGRSMNYENVIEDERRSL